MTVIRKSPRSRGWRCMRSLKLRTAVPVYFQGTPLWRSWISHLLRRAWHSICLERRTFLGTVCTCRGIHPFERVTVEGCSLEIPQRSCRETCPQFQDVTFPGGYSKEAPMATWYDFIGFDELIFSDRCMSVRFRRVETWLFACSLPWALTLPMPDWSIWLWNPSPLRASLRSHEMPHTWDTTCNITPCQG